MRRPFGKTCLGPTLEEIQTPAIDSVRHIAERTGMTEAQVRRRAAQRGVELHRQSGVDFIRRRDIHDRMPTLHERACRREGEDV